MTNLAICKKCRALTPDTENDIGEHRRKAHTEPEADIERARKAGADAQRALELLKAQVRDYEKALDQRPVPVEPEINLRMVEDDELDDDPVATYADDDDNPYGELRTDAIAAFGTDPDDDEAGPPVDPSGLYTPTTTYTTTP